MKNLQILDESILDGRNVAIVGNAGVAESDNNIIDSRQTVRFNNYGSREGIAHTSTRLRASILFTTFDLHTKSASPDHVVIGIPFPFNAHTIPTKMKGWYPDAKRWMVNPYQNLEMNQDLETGTQGFQHPFPSIGFTALWHMKDWNANFYVCGFDWYFDFKSKKLQGWPIGNKNYPKNWNHNYHREIAWVIKHLWKKPNFTFSARCNQILEYVSQNQ